jgi:hypothetical protein
VKAFALSVYVLSHWILIHSLAVKIIFFMLVLMRPLPFLIGIPPLDEAFIYYLHHGLSQALFYCCCCILVSLWTFLLVGFVWEGHVLHRVSHSFKTMLMLNAHPCISLLKVLCHDSHTPFWLSPFLICLFFMLLNHVLVASAKLLVFSLITCTCCEFLLILGEWWSYFVHFVSIYKNSL